jgi:homoserine O-acetyltransferase/O-succinyltransferase
VAAHKIFELGDVLLQKGSVLPDAKLGYLTLGELNEARDNVIVSPTWFTATPSDVAFWLTGPGRAMDPSKYFIVIPNHFGAAVSSSPSNTPAPFDRGRFPRVTGYDSVVAQHRLLTEELGIERVKLVAGWSMGACQTYAWGALFGDMVEALGPINGSARTANYNKVFLRGNIRAITGDPAWDQGFYAPERPPIAGIRAMAAIYAGWAFSEPFYRKELFRVFGARDSDEFVEIFWDAFYSKNDANDLLTQFQTWFHHDIGDHPNFGGDFDAALGAITARTIIIQADTDRYFPPADSEYEASRIPNAELRIITTDWGHMAPFNPDDQQVIDAALRELLGESG